MIWRGFLYFSILSVSSLSALFTGNPAEPNIMKKGIFFGPSRVSFRAGYLDDWVYKQRFQDEFKSEGIAHTRTFLKLSTYAGLLTLNIVNNLDLYGIVGSSRLQIDNEIFTKRSLAWGVGGKLILFKHRNFYCGADAKYFQTNQKPKYFVVEGEPYNIVSNYRLKYKEIEAAVGVSYKASIFAPYINATYILTHIDPEPAVLLVRLPDMEEIVDIESKSIICKKPWGMSLGLTLVDCSKAALAFEWRIFNQNAINVNGEIRF
jgi:hypothetical protein